MFSLQVTSSPWSDARVHGSSFLSSFLQFVSLLSCLTVSPHPPERSCWNMHLVVLLLGYKASWGPLVTRSRGQSPWYDQQALVGPASSVPLSSPFILPPLTLVTGLLDHSHPRAFALAVLAWSAPLLHMCVGPSTPWTWCLSVLLCLQHIQQGLVSV